MEELLPVYFGTLTTQMHMAWHALSNWQICTGLCIFQYHHEHSRQVQPVIIIDGLGKSLGHNLMAKGNLEVPHERVLHLHHCHYS